MRHGIAIPTADKDEMLQFCTEGPRDDDVPPAWINWGAGAPANDSSDDGEEQESAASDFEGDDGDG